jgi:hypothetical protein
MWDATYSGAFSVAYNDGKFAAQGTFGSTQIFAEMGTERNGSFVRREDRDEGDEDEGEGRGCGRACLDQCGRKSTERKCNATGELTQVAWEGAGGVFLPLILTVADLPSALSALGKPCNGASGNPGMPRWLVCG